MKDLEFVIAQFSRPSVLKCICRSLQLRAVPLDRRGGADWVGNEYNGSSNSAAALRSE